MEEDKIKSLKLKGFSNKEISELMSIDIKLVEKIAVESDIIKSSIEVYNDIQKDLSKLILSELGKKDNRDNNCILTALKMQVELQEKKLNISKGEIKVDSSKLFDRDKMIYELYKSGVPIEKIAKDMSVSKFSVIQSIDREELGLSDELKAKVNISVLSETKGLPKDMRMDMIKKAVEENLTKSQVRDMVVGLKNKLR